MSSSRTRSGTLARAAAAAGGEQDRPPVEGPAARLRDKNMTFHDIHGGEDGPAASRAGAGGRALCTRTREDGAPGTMGRKEDAGPANGRGGDRRA